MKIIVVAAILIVMVGCEATAVKKSPVAPVDPCVLSTFGPNQSGTWWTDEQGAHFTVDNDDVYQENKRLKEEIDRLRKHGAAVTHTPDSPAITGDGNTVTYNK